MLCGMSETKRAKRSVVLVAEVLPLTLDCLVILFLANDINILPRTLTFFFYANISIRLRSSSGSVRFQYDNYQAIALFASGFQWEIEYNCIILQEWQFNFY